MSYVARQWLILVVVVTAIFWALWHGIHYLASLEPPPPPPVVSVKKNRTAPPRVTGGGKEHKAKGLTSQESRDAIRKALQGGAPHQ